MAINHTPPDKQIRLDHERWGSSADPNLNGNLHYPNDKDRSLNEAAGNKILEYRTDYNKRFVRLLFLQTHRETERFFSVSGVQFVQSDRGYFHFRRVVFLTQLKSSVGLILSKAAVLRITLNLDGVPITSTTHTHPSLSIHNKQIYVTPSHMFTPSPSPRPRTSRSCALRSFGFLRV